MLKRLGICLASLAAMAAAGASQTCQAAPVNAADIVVIVDESGSMGGEHAWIGGMIASLDTALQAAGVGSGADANRFALVGFGGGSGHPNAHKHTVGGGDFGTAAQFATAATGLVLTGATEDGWSGINLALTGYTFRDAAKNFILVTDEDRDNTNAGLSFAGLLNDLTVAGVVLNSVVNASFGPGTVLGVDGLDNDDSDTGYIADGSGGFTTFSDPNFLGGAGQTLPHYVDLAFATGGAAWDLNRLRVGGATAQSFTKAFIDIKVQEIVDQVVPEPSSIALIGVGGLSLLGISVRRRYRRPA